MAMEVKSKLDFNTTSFKLDVFDTITVENIQLASFDFI